MSTPLLNVQVGRNSSPRSVEDEEPHRCPKALCKHCISQSRQMWVKPACYEPFSIRLLAQTISHTCSARHGGQIISGRVLTPSLPSLKCAISSFGHGLKVCPSLPSFPSCAHNTMEKESKKRKREEEVDPPRITFVSPSKTFERLFRGASLSTVVASR